jgi:hypothetical protein
VLGRALQDVFSHVLARLWDLGLVVIHKKVASFRTGQLGQEQASTLYHFLQVLARERGKGGAEARTKEARDSSAHQGKSLSAQVLKTFFSSDGAGLPLDRLEVRSLIGAQPDPTLLTG